jgi:superfamily II DNA/RNA helicase
MRFVDLSLLETLQQSLAEQQLTTLTDIQRRALPKLLAGSSVVGVAETGSGKTLTYALPILDRLKRLELAGDATTVVARPRAAIIVPTRELGEQVAKVMKPFTHTTRLRVRSVLGGTDLDVAKKNVAGAFEVLVATPGRLVKLLERRLVHLDDCRFLVFDEADQMLDPGFLADAKRIVAACPDARQLALFSATVSKPVQKLMADLFKGVDVIHSEHAHRVPLTLVTDNREVANGERAPVLKRVLSERVKGGTILFVNTRDQVDAVATLVSELGHRCVVYRGEMDKIERKKNLQAFRDGEVDLLVSTDLAARGLDVEHVGRVVNVHLPKDLDNYLHRVGRTARAGRKGVVVNLVTERDRPLIVQVAALKPDAPKR